MKNYQIKNSTGAVIVSYNSRAFLPSCIQSLRANDIANIVVVDNNSDDDSVSTAEQAGATCVPQPRNIGFGAACNIGAAQLTDNAILFINPDTVTEPGAIKLAQDTLNQNRGAAVIGLGLITPQGILEPGNCGHEPTIWHLLTRQVLTGKNCRPTQKVDWVSGAAMLIKKQDFARVHGFDERYFMYWEDVDLCHRLRLAGKQIIINPEAKVWHRRGASTAGLREKTRLYDQSADRYFRKHYATPIWLFQRLARHIYRLFFPLAL
ncbi:MAG: glycosyltransferase family 2 protein [bacterium]|nr:glycosyltransferase family 2 protein [bacterium]